MEEDVLEIGGIVDAGGEQHDLRIFDALGRDLGQRLAQPAPIIIHRHQGHAGEQVGEGAAHEMPVLDDIGDAGRGPGIVLQDAEFAMLVADDVDAADMDIGAEADRKALHLRTVVRIPEHEVGGNYSVANDMTFMIDVMEEAIDGSDALLHTRLELSPLGRRNDPRNAIERKNSINGVGVGIDGEGDPQAHEVVLGGSGAGAEAV
jgi:hypothetical protein